MNLLLPILTLCLVCVVQASYRVHKTRDVSQLWIAFKRQYKKQYEIHEERLRYNIWMKNVDFIQRHNLEYDLGYHTYTVGLNQYADLTPEEYEKYLLGARPPSDNNNTLHGASTYRYKPYSDLPTEIDWRQYGYVTPIKNQGQCGSCWAFSSTGSLEGQHFRLTGRLVSLSEQNLVDCSEKFGNAGCNGGWMMNAFKYVQSNGGIDTEDTYPYEARDDSCRYHAGDRGAEDDGYVMIGKGDESGLQAAVAQVGPVSVAIDATHQSFQLYRSGVYVETNCSRTETDHAVLVVGYGVENGQDYWLVKNSWGTSWGLDGYIKMARNRDNQCAIASFACFPKM